MRLPLRVLPVAFIVAAFGAAAACADTVEVANDDDAGLDSGGGPFTVTDPDASDGRAKIRPRDAEACIERDCHYPYSSCLKPGDDEVEPAEARYKCDIDLRNDPRHCGECDIECPSVYPLHATWDCVQGHCAINCQTGYGNCDGIVDNGCSTDFLSCDPDTLENNCGACGKKCDHDAGLYCHQGFPNGGPGCGCSSGKTECHSELCRESDACKDLKSDPGNCGACGHECVEDVAARPKCPDGHGGFSFEACHQQFGCGLGECTYVCVNQPNPWDAPNDQVWAHCKGPPNVGCETYVGADPNNCGGCNKKCKPDQFCGFDFMSGSYKCVCGPGQVLCRTGDTPTDYECINPLNDRYNCGACGNTCPGYITEHGRPVCTGGRCDIACQPPFDNCTGDITAGCTTNLSTDPRHCGACGHACLPEQVCLEGTCAVVPCDAGPNVTK